MDRLSIVLLLNNFAWNAGDDKIVGGKEAVKNEFPWAASVQSTLKFHHAGATILSKGYVLTACHKIPNSTFYVAAGSIKIKPRIFQSSTTQYRIVEKAVKHPECEELSGAWAYDYAILKLEKDFDTGPNLMPIPLTPYIYTWSAKLDALSDQAEVLCTAVGWGLIQTKKGISDVGSNLLEAVELKAIPIDTCKVKLCAMHPKLCQNHSRQFFDHKVCTRSIDKVERGACDKDEGGPLICHGEVVAIISFVRDCGYNQSVSLHSKIINVFGWIKQLAPQVMIPAEQNATTPPPEAASTFTSSLSIVMWIFIKIF